MHNEVLTKDGQDIFPLLPRFEGFYLAGGTALALQIGHRISVDFDLFSPEEISKTLLSRVKKVFSEQIMVPRVNNADELTLTIGAVKVTFLHYPFPLIEQLVELESMPTASIQEIAAMKAYTIGRRASFKDYVDLYTILMRQDATLEEIITLAQKKYREEFNDRLFLEQLISLDDIEDEEIVFLNTEVKKSKINLFLEEEVKKVKL